MEAQVQNHVVHTASQHERCLGSHQREIELHCWFDLVRGGVVDDEIVVTESQRGGLRWRGDYQPLSSGAQRAVKWAQSSPSDSSQSSLYSAFRVSSERKGRCWGRGQFLGVLCPQTLLLGSALESQLCAAARVLKSWRFGKCCGKCHLVI